MANISIIPKIQTRASLSTAKSVLKYSPILAAIALLVVIYVVFLIQNVTLKKKILETESQFAQNEARVKKEIGMNSYALGESLDRLGQILASRLYWSQFLGKEEKVFSSDVNIKSSQFDMKDFKINVTGSVPSYERLEKLLSELKESKDLVATFTLIDSSFTENNVSFTMEVVFEKELLEGPYSL